MSLLLLDTSFLIDIEHELASARPGPATAVSAARRTRLAAISIVTLGEFAGGFLDPVPLSDFVRPFRIGQLSRVIAWRSALLQTSLSPRLGENDAWIAGTALAYGATLVGRERAFARAPLGVPDVMSVAQHEL